MHSLPSKLLTPIKILFGFITLLAMAVSCTDDRKNLDLYEFDETKKLVAFVEDAASLIHTKGLVAFRDFAQKDSKWLRGNRYLFAYDLYGTCMQTSVIMALAWLHSTISMHRSPTA